MAASKKERFYIKKLKLYNCINFQGGKNEDELICEREK